MRYLPARLFALISLAIPLAAVAEPLKSAWIPAEATWVVHVDVQAAAASTIGRYAVENRDLLKGRGMQQVRLQTGIDPAQDLKGITIFGESCEPEDAVALISATAATDSFLDRLRAQESSYKQVQGERFLLDSWTEHGSPRYGFVRKNGDNERLILVARDRAKLEQAIARTDPAAPAGPLNTMLDRGPGAGSIVFAAATDISSAASKAKGLAVQQMRNLRLDMGETAAGEIYAEGLIAAETPQDAQNLKQMLEGALAMGRMAAHRRPELGELAQLSHSVAVQTSDTTLTVSFRHDSARALDMLKSMYEARTGVPAPDAEPKPAHGDDRKP